MKSLLHFFLPVTLVAFFSHLFSNPALAQVEADFGCFLITSSGATVNLEPLCRGEQQSFVPEMTGNNPLVISNVRYGGGGIVGEITNRSDDIIELTAVSYTISHNPGARLTSVITDIAPLSMPILYPGETTFADDFSLRDVSAMGRYFPNSLGVSFSYGGFTTARMQMRRDARLNGVD